MRHTRNMAPAGALVLAGAVGVVAIGGAVGRAVVTDATFSTERVFDKERNDQSRDREGGGRARSGTRLPRGRGSEKALQVRSEVMSRDHDGSTTAGPPTTTAAAEQSPTSRPADDRAAVEAQFKKVLEGAVLKGTWQVTNAAGLAGKAPLSKPRPDRYTISSARKLTGDRWVITARIEYGEKDVKVPVPVRVVWAGDTPIITLDKINIPLIGAYSARVMIYNHFYCGAWFGKDYGGILSGQIIRQEDEKQLEAASKAERQPGYEPEPADAPTATPKRPSSPERR